GGSAGFGAPPGGVGRSISRGAPRGALGVVEPMTLGAPGAFGSSAGSKASFFFGFVTGGGSESAATGGDAAGLPAGFAPLKRNSTSSRKRLNASSSRWFWFCNS